MATLFPPFKGPLSFWVEGAWASIISILSILITSSIQATQTHPIPDSYKQTPLLEQPVITQQQELRTFLKNTISSSDSFYDRFDAEVWLVDMSSRLERFIKDPKQRLELLRAIHREATIAKLKPDLVLALIEVESHFDHYAVSRAGALGLMQVMPFWKKEIGRPEDNLIDIDTNLRYGCRILQFYMKKESGNWMNALARYNGSLGQYWYPERVMNAWKKRWYTTNHEHSTSPSQPTLILK